MQRTLKNYIKNNGGYTLIELAIVMIVIGVLTGSFLSAYSIYQRQEMIRTTDTNVQLITRTIGNFRTMNGRYPCPSSLTANREDANYGHESDCSIATPVAGNCGGGLCAHESLRTITLEDSSVITPRVRTGAVPFRQLGLPEDITLDGYGNRITYAVTERLAVSETFALDHGGLEIYDGDDPAQSILNPPASGHFILISHGANGAGSYTRHGFQTEPCLSDGTLEALNCPRPAANAEFRLAQVSSGDNEDYFDDVISYHARGAVSPWEVTDTDSIHLFYKNLSAEAKVAIDMPAASALSERLTVGGTVRGSDNVISDAYCDYDGGACTYTALIAGQEDEGGGMRCPPGEFMVEIINNAPVCRPEVFTHCPSGRTLIGINANGTLNCSGPPHDGCDTQTVSLCDTDRTLAAGSHGTTRTITAGASRTQTFRCDEGSWRSISNSGECVCEPETRTRTRSCSTGFEGERIQEREYICPEGNWTSWRTIEDNCECVGANRQRTVSCPTNYDGTIREEREFVCTSATSGSWTLWEEISNTCECNERTETRTRSCSGGLTGTVEQERHLQCPSGSWTSWTETSNSCSCEELTSVSTGSCPDGYVGEIRRENNFTCPEAEWSGWEEVSNTCEPEPPVICIWESTGTGHIESARRGQRTGSVCECGASGTCFETAGTDTYINYNSCRCQ